eukprot:CAMPEP_0184517442 /NCGR_PEP_ID=MMETSP0198_2-20121128/5560_1 /TAXON_ID=1112570 /ORGANISM="Thraustochytrium sp., Strain LLF1b" /LENGTH=595 /DNA_ID=CAMNT_0026907821 /DNA_START=343 /DNA_END=2130 /DNA_ORIENTATION=+
MENFFRLYSGKEWEPHKELLCDKNGTPYEYGAYPVHENEMERLCALRELHVLDTEPQEKFDRVTKLATKLFDCEISLVSLVDTSRQVFISRCGLDARETCRKMAFCNYVVADPSLEALVVTDAKSDRRFQNNPLVLGAPNIRFYAGVPLILDEKKNLACGTLCVIDSKRRQKSLTVEEVEMLQTLARGVVKDLKAESSLQALIAQHNNRLAAVGHSLRNLLHVLKSSEEFRQSNNVTLLENRKDNESIYSVESVCQALSSTLEYLRPDEEDLHLKTIQPVAVLRDAVVGIRFQFPNLKFEVSGDLNEGTVVTDQAALHKIIDAMLHTAGSAVQSHGKYSIGEEGNERRTVNCRFESRNSSYVLRIWVHGSAPEVVRQYDGTLAFFSETLEQARRYATKLDTEIDSSDVSERASIFEMKLEISDASTHGDDEIESFLNAEGVDLSVEEVKNGEPEREMEASQAISPVKLKEVLELVVVICDDEKANRFIMKSFLKRLGVKESNITIFEDGDEIDPRNIEEPDLCLLDIFMNRENGDSLCLRLRKARWMCPIIATTGNCGMDSELRSCGFNRIIHKPYTKTMIGEVLEHVAKPTGSR